MLVARRTEHEDTQCGLEWKLEHVARFEITDVGVTGLQRGENVARCHPACPPQLGRIANKRLQALDHARVRLSRLVRSRAHVFRDLIDDRAMPLELGAQHARLLVFGIFRPRKPDIPYRDWLCLCARIIIFRVCLCFLPRPLGLGLSCFVGRGLPGERVPRGGKTGQMVDVLVRGDHEVQLTAARPADIFCNLPHAVGPVRGTMQRPEINQQMMSYAFRFEAHEKAVAEQPLRRRLPALVGARTVTIHAHRYYRLGHVIVSGRPWRTARRSRGRHRVPG